MPSKRGYDAVVAALAGRGGRLTRRHDVRGRESVRTKCPAHADARPSLVVTKEGDGRALVHCFGGCKLRAILATVGLRMSDLFATGPPERVRPQVEAVYEYFDLDGVLHGVKVRYRPKSFRWREHDDAVSLYRLPDLLNRPTVMLTEGEKGADRLWSLGIPSTCGPNGASNWRDAWSRDLWTAGCRTLIILADNDRAGRDHSERVAEAKLERRFSLREMRNRTL